MQLLTRFETGLPGSSIAYDVCKPLPESPRGLLVVIHGHGRSTRLAEAFTKRAATEELVLLAPVFDVEQYKDFQILRGSTGPLAAADALNTACDDASRIFGFTSSPFTIVGFSAGAQFAHRYAMCFPARVAALVAASAGWYTMPNRRLRFPYGCAASDDLPAGVHDLNGFLEIPVRVMVGENDTGRDALLRKSKSIDRAQGWNRLERAKNWVRALDSCASTRGVVSKVSLEVLPECGHSARDAIRKGGLVRRSISFLNRERTSPIHEAEAESSGLEILPPGIRGPRAGADSGKRGGDCQSGRFL